MASIEISGIGVTDIAGSVGGTTFQRNANGRMARDRVKPAYPGTSYQIGQAGVFSTVVGEWAQLSQSQQDAWIAFAAGPAGEYQNRLGQTQHYTGQQLFIKLNLAAYDESFPILDPPRVPVITVTRATGLTILTTPDDLSIFQVNYDDRLGAGTRYIKIYATSGLSPGINRPKSSLFRLITTVEAATDDPWIDIKEPYYQRLGVPTLNSKVFVRQFWMDKESGFEVESDFLLGRVQLIT